MGSGNLHIPPNHAGGGGMFRGHEGQGSEKPEPGKLPKVEFYDDLGLLGMFFAEAMQIPNAIVQTYTLEIANGKVAVLSDGKEEQKSQYYARIRMNLGAQDAENPKHIEPIPILVTVTKPIPIPVSVGRIAGFPVHRCLDALNQLINLPDDKRPTHVRLKFEAIRDEKTGEVGGKLEVRQCNENGGYIALLKGDGK